MTHNKANQQRIPSGLRPPARRWTTDWRSLIAGLVVVAGCASDPSTGDDQDTPPEKPVPVHAAPARSITLHPSINLIGTLVAMPEHTAVITAQIAGRIKQVAIVEGDPVKSGQRLVQLDPRVAEAQLQRAQAKVAQQQAILARLRNGYLPQEIEMAKQDGQKAKAKRESLRLRLAATRKLHEQNEVSDVELEKLTSQLVQAQAVYAAAVAKLDLYQAGTRPEQIAEAESQVAVAQAEQDRARLEVEYCNITSPIDGIVTQLSARQGMGVSPLDQFATVVNLSQLFVRLRVPGAYLSKVQPGAKIDVSIPTLQKEKIMGHIARLSGKANPNTADVTAFGVVSNVQGHLKPGLSCRVRVWLPDIEKALVVPVAAVADRSGVPIVSVVRSEHAYEVEVRVGVETRQYVQIIDGLAAGDVVITEGGYSLPDGCPVHVLP